MEEIMKADVRQYYNILQDIKNLDGNDINLVFSSPTTIIDVTFNRITTIYLSRYVNVQEFKIFVILYYNKILNEINENMNQEHINSCSVACDYSLCDLCNVEMIKGFKKPITVYDKTTCTKVEQIQICHNCYDNLYENKMQDECFIYIP